MKKQNITFMLWLSMAPFLFGQTPFTWKKIEFEVDVVINGTDMEANGILAANGASEGGTNYFLLNGIIYPGGTLIDKCPLDPIYGFGCGIIDDQASGLFIPEFNDDVIGTWDCKGWFTENLLQISEGIFDVSVQTFTFPNGIYFGSELVMKPGTIVTDGAVERGFLKEAKRAIIGGYGGANGAIGDVTGKLLGGNPSNAINFSTTFTIWIPVF